MFWSRRDNPSTATVLLATEAVARSHEARYESAVELLGLAFSQSPEAGGWLGKWALLTALRRDLETKLGTSAYSAAWKRGEALALESTIDGIVEASRPASAESQPGGDDILAGESGPA